MFCISCGAKIEEWCTDFTYLFLNNREVRYNCTIIELYDRSVIASITDSHITSDLAIRTLQKALASQTQIKGELILHSDQGTQFTSKAFVEYRLALRLHTWRTQPLFLFGWGLFPLLPENRTRWHTCVHVLWYLRFLWHCLIYKTKIIVYCL